MYTYARKSNETKHTCIGIHSIYDIPTLTSLGYPSHSVPRPMAQHEAYEAIRLSAKEVLWSEYLVRRIMCVADMSCVQVGGLDFDSILSNVKRCSGFIAMCWVKTMTSSWTTSVRMHEDVEKSCIFGSRARDMLQHYICPLLWRAARRASSFPFCHDLLGRLAVKQSFCSEGRYILALVFLLYHNHKYTST